MITTPFGLFAQVATIMLHNEPLLESILVLPLILKSYRSVLIGCLLVAAVTFGVEMHNDYSPSNLLSPLALTLFAVQAALLVAISAVVFALKTRLLKAFGLAESKARNAAPPAP